MATDRDSSAASIVLEIPLSALPPGTRFRVEGVEAEELVRLYAARHRSMELVLTDSSGKKPLRPSASQRFLQPNELVRSGYGELSVSEAAKQLNISRQAVLTAVKRGAIAARRVGGVFLVDAESVRTYRPRAKSDGKGGAP